MRKISLLLLGGSLFIVSGVCAQNTKELKRQEMGKTANITKVKQTKIDVTNAELQASSMTAPITTPTEVVKVVRVTKVSKGISGNKKVVKGVNSIVVTTKKEETKVEDVEKTDLPTVIIEK
jgi:hypothetical protein